ncbi:MAG: hypothetical protein JW804_03685 [Sedimentisphaerales bacterium]|nr:hypothetical protein [Sedimentisphaerales bacterium]
MDFAIIITVYGIAIGIVVCCIIFAWQVKSENEKLRYERDELRRENKKLEEEIGKAKIRSQNIPSTS